MSHITVLTAGQGGARFLGGVVDVREEEDVHVVANVGSDYQSWGLRCSPDVDLILHTLSGEVDPYQSEAPGGTFGCFEAMRKLGMSVLPHVSDRQLATDLLRTTLLNAGADLESATAQLAERFGIGVELVPATNDSVHTTLHTTTDGPLRPLEYRARRDECLSIERITYEGAARARTSQRALDSILGAERVIVGPADPELELGALLALSDLRNALARTRASVVAVSPVIGSQPARGDVDTFADRPAGEACAVVRFAESLRGTIDSLVIHTSDIQCLDRVRATGIDAWVDNILIYNRDDATRLAGRVAHGGRLVARKR